MINMNELKYTEAERKIYRDGFMAGAKYGISLYAWWRDGVQYVGCGVLTLKAALEKLINDIEEHNG